MNDFDSLAVTRKELIEALGPAPDIKATAKYIRVDEMKVYRWVVDGTLERLPGKGSIRISIPSLLRYLNAAELHTIDPGKASRRRGKKNKPKAAAPVTPQLQQQPQEGDATTFTQACQQKAAELRATPEYQAYLEELAAEFRQAALAQAAALPKAGDRA